jgi:predicted anti-sigma-YlaC factor YlaD
MKCQDLLDALNDYVDGETQSALCRAIQEHLANCNPCRIVIDNIRQTITLYRAGEALPLPAGLRDRIRSAVHERWTALYPRTGRLRQDRVDSHRNTFLE